MLSIGVAYTTHAYINNHQIIIITHRARPSGPGDCSHLTLQSDMDLKKLGSFLVPFVSPLSFGFWPGTIGALPVLKMVSSAIAGR